MPKQSESKTRKKTQSSAKTEKKTSKSAEEAEVTSSGKMGWLIILIISAVAVFFTLTKMGILGLLAHDLLSIIAGSLYIVPLLIIFVYAVYAIFLADRYQISGRMKSGLWVLNGAILLLYAYLCDETRTFAALSAYCSKVFALVKDAGTIEKTGGIIGNFLYVLLFTLISRTGTLIVIIVSLLIAALLIVPGGVYRKIFNDTKEGLSERKEARKQRRLAQEQERLQAEEERRARLAEDLARLNEEEERKAKQQEEIIVPEPEEIIVEEEEPEYIIPHEHDYVLSKSPTFINLSDEEIIGKKKNKNKNRNTSIASTSSAEKQVQMPLSEDIGKPRVLKPRKSRTYKLPRPYEEFLESAGSSTSSLNKTSASVKGEKVIEILQNFGISAQLVNTYIGPSVTKFEIKPDSSVKVNKIMAISDNIKMELAARDIRIEAPIPGRSAVGIEIPNVEPVPVKMLDLIKAVPADKRKLPLLFCLGKDLMGRPVYCDLVKMPHLLIAGATGAGKSVCINAIITSFLLRTYPDDVKLVLVDPKKVEFTPYKDIPHLLWPIIDDPQMASNMLKKVVVIMEERYEAFATAGVRNIDGFNSYVEDYNANLKEGEEPMKKLPYIVIIIDELADLMAIAGKEVELSIQRITQLARASGIHLVVATQRPSTDVITGLIKSNIPSRISFAVASSIDSRTILDQTGAERLLGNGDMLYYPQGETAPIRMQGVYVTDKEIGKVTKYVKSQAEPEYEDSYFEFLTNMSGTTVMSATSVNADSMDSLYDEVVEFVRNQQKASTSLLQRRFGIGYNRAARLIDTMEDRGVIGPANGSKPREVYLKPDDFEEEEV